MRTVRAGSSSRCHSVRGRLRPTGPPRGPDVRRRPEIRALRPPRTAVRRLRVDRSADHARRRGRRPARAAPGEPVRPSIRRASCARRTSSAAAVSTKVPPLPAGGGGCPGRIPLGPVRSAVSGGRDSSTRRMPRPSLSITTMRRVSARTVGLRPAEKMPAAT